MVPTRWFIFLLVQLCFSILILMPTVRICSQVINQFNRLVIAIKGLHIPFRLVPPFLFHQACFHSSTKFLYNHNLANNNLNSNNTGKKTNTLGLYEILVNTATSTNLYFAPTHSPVSIPSVNTQPSESTKLSDGAIVGIVIAVLVLVVFIIGLLVYFGVVSTNSQIKVPKSTYQSPDRAYAMDNRLIINDSSSSSQVSFGMDNGNDNNDHIITN